MRLCLTHPQYGYYINRDPLGAGGDFVTSPEISQMFGELIGLWMAAVWQQMGAPENVRIVELGPGRGTLMFDALRAAHVVNGFPRGDRRCIWSRSVRRCNRCSSGGSKVSTCRCCGTPRSTRSRPVRASSSPTNSSMRCRCIRPSSKRTAGMSASSTSRPDGHLVIGTARDPLPFFEAAMPRALRQRARRRDLRMALGQHRARTRTAHARRRERP